MVVIKPNADGYIPELQDFNLLQFNLIKIKSEQNALLNIGNTLAEKIILTKFTITDADKGPWILQCVILKLYYYNLTSMLTVLLKVFDPILQEAWLK